MNKAQLQELHMDAFMQDNMSEGFDTYYYEEPEETLAATVYAQEDFAIEKVGSHYFVTLPDNPDPFPVELDQIADINKVSWVMAVETPGKLSYVFAQKGSPYDEDRARFEGVKLKTPTPFDESEIRSTLTM